MAEPPDEAYLQPYREAVRRHGPGFAATLWNSREAQRLRFDVMIGMVHDAGGLEGRALLDVGCGEGDLAAHLGEAGVEYRSYVGIDALPEVIERAAARGLPRCRFLAADAIADPAVLVTGDPDWVCISGTLNTMDEGTARALVGRAFEAAALGVVFNFLSTRAHERHAGRDTAPARRFDPVRWLDFTLGLTSRVVLDHAYLDGHDATILAAHDG